MRKSFPYKHPVNRKRVELFYAEMIFRVILLSIYYILQYKRSGILLHILIYKYFLYIQRKTIETYGKKFNIYLYRF